MNSPAIPGRGRKAHPRAQVEGLPVWESPFRRGSSLLCWAVRDPLPPHPWKHPLLLLMPKARSASRNVVWNLNSQSCVEAGVPPEHRWASAKDRSPKNGGLSRRERLAGIRSSGRTRVWLLWPGEVGEGGPQAALLTPSTPHPPSLQEARRSTFSCLDTRWCSPPRPGQSLAPCRERRLELTKDQESQRTASPPSAPPGQASPTQLPGLPLSCLSSE